MSIERGAVEAGIRLRRIQQGVYQKRILGWPVRVVVINRLPQEEHNAPLLLFSNRPDRFAFAARHFQPRSTDTSTLLLQLVQQYRQEGVAMPDLLDEFVRETRVKMLKEMPPEMLLNVLPLEKRLEGVPLEKRLEGVPLEKRLEGVPLEKRLEGVPLDKRLEGASANDLLAALPPEMREALFQQLKAERGG